MGRFGELRVKLLEFFDYQLCDDKVSIPLTVGGDDVPGCVVGGCFLDCILVGCFVIGPQFSVFDVFRDQLPLFVRVCLAGNQSLFLFLVADVEEDFEGGGTFIREHSLKFVAVTEPLAPNGFGLEFANANGEDVLVVAAVEDADAAIGGGVLMDSPEVVSAQLFFAGLPEGCDLDALRVEATEDVPYRAILAGGVHSLEDYDDAVLLLGKEDDLKVVEFLFEGSKALNAGQFSLFAQRFIVGIPLGEFHL